MIYCGIDIAKRKHDAVILDDTGKPIGKPIRFSNTAEGFSKLETILREQEQTVILGLEATGHYWLALYDAFSRQGYDIVVMNPLQVAAYRRSGIRKVKNDRKDAFWIADYLRIANLPATDPQMPVLLQLRELCRFRYALMDQVATLKRKVISILDRVFPEYETIFSNIFVKSSRLLLQEAATAEEIAKFDLSELVEILRTASRGRFGQEKAERLQTAAKGSIGVSFLTNAVQVEMKFLLQQMDLMLEQIASLDETIEELMETIPQHITMIPGVGPVTGAAILSEIGDVRRFESSEQLVAYAGIDPTVYETGQFKASQAHMSKRGSPHLRRALWQSASMAAMYEPQLKAYYMMKREEGKHHNIAVGAVCRKLLARIYIILKENRPYVVRN